MVEEDDEELAILRESLEQYRFGGASDGRHTGRRLDGRNSGQVRRTNERNRYVVSPSNVTPFVLSFDIDEQFVHQPEIESFDDEGSRVEQDQTRFFTPFGGGEACEPADPFLADDLSDRAGHAAV